MSDIDTNDYRGRFEFVEFGYNVPEGDFARFVRVFIREVLSILRWKMRHFHQVGLEERLTPYTRCPHQFFIHMLEDLLKLV